MDLKNSIEELAATLTTRSTTAARIVKALRLPLLCALWLLLVGAGLAMIWRYSNTPGQTPKPSEDWPADSTLRRVSGKPSLIMFVHPKCSCSRASLNELASLLAHSGGNLDAHVVFIEPSGKIEEWRNSDLWRMASEIPGVTAIEDEGGAESRLFHASISGDTFLYDPLGQLQFRGGITASRGHEGDNAGRAALEMYARTGSAPLAGTPVFGCPLYAPCCPSPQ